MPAKLVHVVFIISSGAIAYGQQPTHRYGTLGGEMLSEQTAPSKVVQFLCADTPITLLSSTDHLAPVSTPYDMTSVPPRDLALPLIHRDDSESTDDLPDAPQPQYSGQQVTGSISPSQDQARISGLVLDPSGASISGAEITISGTVGSRLLTLPSGADGRFSFAMPAASYVITVRATGFTTYVSKTVVLAARQTYELQQIVLQVESTSTEVTVRPTEQAAAEQLKAEERQRVFGLFPNFFTSYVYDAAPLTAKQKLSLTAHDTFDPVSLFGVVSIAGIEQAERTYPGYGNDALGFGKRFGAALGDTLTSDFLGHAIFPALLHEDPRYFYRGSGTKKQRLYHAVSYAFVTRSDSGHLKPNLSYLLGDIGSGALSNLYYPHADRGVGLVFTQAAIGIAGQAAGAVVREFFSRRLTTNVPGDGRHDTLLGN